MNRILQRSISVLVLLTALFTTTYAAQTQAQTCPFDDGYSSLQVEGLILTRYALGLTGAPLVASTNINAVDAPTVEATISCPSCGLNITGNATLTVADATIISRKLAGFSGSSLTAGLALGSGTRNTPALVQSFLLAGCGATGSTVTSIIAGSGLLGGNITTSGTIAADTTFLQRRVATPCAAGSFITSIAADGTPTCATPATGAGGTVTNVATGTGLTGGPITATGTIAVDSAVVQLRVASSCSANTFITAIAANGTVTCAAPSAGTSGTVTSVATGAGLTGGPISTTGTLSIAVGGVTSNLLAPNLTLGGTTTGTFSGPLTGNVTGNVTGNITGNASTFSGALAGDVTGTQGATLVAAPTVTGKALTGFVSAAGTLSATDSILTAINKLDGNIALKAPLASPLVINPASSTVTTVDGPNLVGQYSAITLGADGLPVISYYDTTNGDLKVAKCSTAACTGANTVTTVDSVGIVGLHTSITLGADGLPVISYYDLSNGDLKAAKCINAACTGTSTLTTVDSVGNVGLYTSITVGADGLPVISYIDSTNNDLKVAKCVNAACTGASTLTTVDSAGILALETSITLGADGLPVISYFDGTNGALKVAKCGNAACTGASTLTIIDGAGSVGRYSSITLGADGLPVISYYDGANSFLRVAKCGNAACTGASTVTIVDNVGSVGLDTSITLGADGLPIISYYNITNGNLKVAKCVNATCTGASIVSTLDSAGTVGSFTSITLGVDGLPVVSYYDSTNSDLKVAKCTSATCVPFLRRR